MQASRVEIIEDLQDMARVSGSLSCIADIDCICLARSHHVYEIPTVSEEKTGQYRPFTSYILQRFVAVIMDALCTHLLRNVDRVSEGQFKQVLDSELQSLKGKFVSPEGS